MAEYFVACLRTGFQLLQRPDYTLQQVLSQLPNSIGMASNLTGINYITPTLSDSCTRVIIYPCTYWTIGHSSSGTQSHPSNICTSRRGSDIATIDGYHSWSTYLDRSGRYVVVSSWLFFVLNRSSVILKLEYARPKKKADAGLSTSW